MPGQGEGAPMCHPSVPTPPKLAELQTAFLNAFFVESCLEKKNSNSEPFKISDTGERGSQEYKPSPLFN